MATFPLFQTSYLRQAADLRDAQRLHAWYQAIAAQSFFVHALAESGTFNPWIDIYQHHTIPAGVSAPAQQAIATFSQGTGNSLACEATHVQDEFTMLASVLPDDGTTVLLIDSGLLSTPAVTRRNEALLLEQIVLSYEHWHPFFGLLSSESPAPAQVDRSAVLAGTMPGLFEITLLGPELVTALGQARVLSAPAWRVQALHDGGALIVPGPYLDNDPAYPYQATRDAVARHLGLRFIGM